MQLHWRSLFPFALSCRIACSLCVHRLSYMSDDAMRKRISRISNTHKLVSLVQVGHGQYRTLAGYEAITCMLGGCWLPSQSLRCIHCTLANQHQHCWWQDSLLHSACIHTGACIWSECVHANVSGYMHSLTWLQDVHAAAYAQLVCAHLWHAWMAASQVCARCSAELRSHGGMLCDRLCCMCMPDAGAQLGW